MFVLLSSDENVTPYLSLPTWYSNKFEELNFVGFLFPQQIHRRKARTGGHLPFMMDYVRANFLSIVNTHSFLGLDLAQLKRCLLITASRYASLLSPFNDSDEQEEKEDGRRRRADNSGDGSKMMTTTRKGMMMMMLMMMMMMMMVIMLMMKTLMMNDNEDRDSGLCQLTTGAQGELEWKY